MIDQYYKVTIPTLLKSLGPQLESLHIIHEPIDPAFFNTLDDAGYKIKNLVLGKTSQIDTLIQSKQTRYIEILVLEIDPSLSFRWLSHMKVLRSFSCSHTITRSKPTHSSPLYLEYRKRMTISATTLFYSCSETVESMDIPVEFIDFNVKKKKVFPITKLTLDCKWWPKEIVTFISNCLLHLKSLAMRICTRDDENLASPNHHFDYLDIDFNSGISCTISLTTLNDNSTRYYNGSDPQLQTGQYHFDDYIYPIAEPDDRGYLKIFCGSVKGLVIEGLHAHLVSN
jgi:hypothetical protein